MNKTSIEWTDRTWNPVTGCTKVSRGCKHCYAETIAKRFWKDRPFGEVMCHNDRLDQPLHWRKPSRIFVNSMSDLFHPDVPADFIGAVWLVMEQCQRHTFQVLTKRPRWMRKLVRDFHHPNNVWLGVSCELQSNANDRIPVLLDTPAAIRWVSLEPLLGPIDLSPWIDKLDWVVVGCESGRFARPMSNSWVRVVKDQCVAADVPFFFKQQRMDGTTISMPELDGQRWAQYPSIGM